MSKATLVGFATGAVLAPGSIASGRFLIRQLNTMFGPIVVYNATDQKTQREIALWAVPPGLLPPDVVSATRSAIKAACTITHKDLVASFGSSSDPAGTLFVATEPLGPTSVADLIEKKQKEGHVHGLQAAYQLLAYVMNALAAVHSVMAHGAVCPAMVRIDAQGHVKLAGLGMVSALTLTNVMPKEYIAPEVRKGAPPTPRSDIYSLGAMLYQLCTGKTPDPSQPASSIVNGLPSTFDIIIENCMAESPDDRFESVTEVKGALASLVAPSVHPPPPSEALDIPIEIDDSIDVQAAIAAAPPRRLTIPPGSIATRTAPARGATPPAAAAGSSISLAEMITNPSAPTPHAKSIDLKGLLDHVTTDDAPRWMFVRGGLDHGPLTARELVQAIVRNEVLEDNVVFNMDTGERKKLIEWPQFRELAEQAREKRRREQHDREVRSAIAEDKISARAKAAVATTLVVVAAGLGVVYYKTLGPGRSEARRQAELDDAIARGQLRLSESGLQVLETPPPPTTRRTSSSGGSSAGFGSYEAAMNQPVEYNFNGNVGGGTLSDREIAAPLNAALGRFGSCATAEIARGGNAREVRMRIAVGGNGVPMGVTVLTGSPAFKNCIANVVRGLRWRAFGGPRIGFAWGFSLQ